MTTMLYKYPGPHEIHGDKFDYVIVEDDKIDDAIDSGWFLTTTEAKSANQVDIDDVVKNDKPKRGRKPKAVKDDDLDSEDGVD